MKGYNKNSDCAKRTGERFNMDFGFVKSSAKDGEEKIETSFDGYNSYLLITDEYF